MHIACIHAGHDSVVVHVRTSLIYIFGSLNSRIQGRRVLKVVRLWVCQWVEPIIRLSGDKSMQLVVKSEQLDINEAMSMLYCMQ